MNRNQDIEAKTVSITACRRCRATGKVPLARSTQSIIQKFQSTLIARLQRGEHLVLFGPRGSGKSTLLDQLYMRLAHHGARCALLATTSSLNDITCALVHAYPDVDTIGVTRRRVRARLMLAADRQIGVLLLDHVTHISTAMLGFVRRLRGGVVGILMAVEVDVERERQALRQWHLGVSSLSMPPLSTRQLHTLFRAHCADLKIPDITPAQERQIIHATRGRPGWVMQCSRLIAHNRYWRDQMLYASVLCTDTEIALRQGPLRLLPYGNDIERTVAHTRVVRGCRTVIAPTGQFRRYPRKK